MIHVFNTTAPNAQLRWRNCGPGGCRYCAHGNVEAAKVGSESDTADSLSSEGSIAHQNMTWSSDEHRHTNSVQNASINLTSFHERPRHFATPAHPFLSWSDSAFVPTQNRSVFISGVPYNVSKADFEAFLRHETVKLTACQLRRQERGRGRVTSAVTWYDTVEQAQNAIKILHGYSYKDRQLHAREGRDSEVFPNQSHADIAQPRSTDTPPIANGSGIQWHPPGRAR